MKGGQRRLNEVEKEVKGGQKEVKGGQKRPKEAKGDLRSLKEVKGGQRRPLFDGRTPQINTVSSVRAVSTVSC